MLRCSADSEAHGHGYFSAEKFLVLAPVALARSIRFTICGAFLLVLSLPLITHAFTDPGKPTGYVNDFANVIPADQELALNQKLAALDRDTSDEVVVVTVSSLGDETVESYATKLFEKWGIGTKAHDNGILILVSTGDHEARIEVGYGLEGTVTDLQSGNIIRSVMIPAFRNNDYAAGISGGVDAVTSIITNSPDAAQYSVPENSNQLENALSSSNINWSAIIFFGIFLLNILVRILGATKSWWLGGVLGAGAGTVIGVIWGFLPAGITAIIVLTLLGLLFDYIVSKHPPGSGRGGVGGFWPIFMGRGGSGGFGGGGFGGFGGGSSGGGGASGKW